MASRITLYGKPTDPDIKRLTREMNVMFLEFEQRDPARDPLALRRLQEWGEAWGEKTGTRPVVEVQREDDQGSIFLTNPDEPTLRQCLYSEGILSVTSYWV